MRQRYFALSAILCFFLLAALAAGSEIVVLKGGKSLELSKPYMVKGSQAIMTLNDGTVISVSAADIDKDATAQARARAAAPAEPKSAPAAATSPAEAVRLHAAAPKASLKFNDDNFSHGGYEEPGAAKSDEKPQTGDGSLDVADWDQSVEGESVVIKGSLVFSGGETARNIGVKVTAMDASGNVVGSSSASVSSAVLQTGGSATFSASIPGKARFAAIKFQPRWSSPPPPANAAKNDKDKAGSAAASNAAQAAAKTPAPEKPKQAKYTPSPDYAAPAPSAPTSAPTDNRTGYIPGAHVETSTPPPTTQRQ